MNQINIKPLTVNQCWQGKRYKTPAYKAYEQEMLLRLPKLDVPDGDLQVVYEFGFSNKQADWDNPVKPFQDLLQKAYGFDDKRILRAVVEKRMVKRGHEYIRFEISAYRPSQAQ